MRKVPKCEELRRISPSGSFLSNPASKVFHHAMILRRLRFYKDFPRVGIPMSPRDARDRFLPGERHMKNIPTLSLPMTFSGL